MKKEKHQMKKEKHQMSAPNYLTMTEQEFDEALFQSLPEDLRRQISESQGASQSAKDELAEQFIRNLSAELTEAMCEREARRIALEYIHGPCSIVDLFAEDGIEAPARFSHLALPRMCSN